jgi:glycosyltransferase involved in cell wall biosynthesis
MPDQQPGPFESVAVRTGEHRPLWSVCIPVFNCGEFLALTLRSVLEQGYETSEMEVEVVDDHSEDDPGGIVSAVAGGRVAYHRHSRNMGHVRNFNACIGRARGELLHLLHGDDLVLPGFYSTMERVFCDNPGIGAAFCRHHYIDARGNIIKTSPLVQTRSGVLVDAAERLARQQLVQPPSIVVRRAVYESVGLFDERMKTCGEDWEMWVRIASKYPVWYEAEPLAQYRRHERSLAARSLRSGQNMKDVRTAIGIFGKYLSEDAARSIVPQARESAALWALSLAERARRAGEGRVALVQVREALRTRRSARTLRVTAGLLKRILLDGDLRNRETPRKSE